jgi:hypothetical protein
VRRQLGSGGNRSLGWVETLAGFVDDGLDSLVFWPVDPAPGQVELLAGEVVPHVRRSG